MAGQRLRFKRAAKESVECVGGERQKDCCLLVASLLTARATYTTRSREERRMSTLLIGATHSLRSLRTKIIHNNRKTGTYVRHGVL